MTPSPTVAPPSSTSSFPTTPRHFQPEQHPTTISTYTPPETTSIVLNRTDGYTVGRSVHSQLIHLASDGGLDGYTGPLFQFHLPGERVIAESDDPGPRYLSIGFYFMDADIPGQRVIYQQTAEIPPKQNNIQFLAHPSRMTSRIESLVQESATIDAAQSNYHEAEEIVDILIEQVLSSVREEKP